MSPVAVALRCAWPPCCRAIEEDDDTVESNSETYHAACRFRMVDEDELCEFLDQIAEDGAAKIAEYKAAHPTRTNEHRARALLARIAAVIAATGCGEHASESTRPAA